MYNNLIISYLLFLTEEFSKNVPKSPIRELLELETDRVKFGYVSTIYCRYQSIHQTYPSIVMN